MEVRELQGRMNLGYEGRGNERRGYKVGGTRGRNGTGELEGGDEASHGEGK